MYANILLCSLYHHPNRCRTRKLSPQKGKNQSRTQPVMIRLQCLSNPTISPNPSRCISSSSSSSCCPDQIPINNSARILPFRSQSTNPSSLSSTKPLLRFFCRASLGRDSQAHGGDQFVQASLLVSETVKHYSLWKQGFVENTKWHSPGREHQFSYRRKGDESNTSSIGHGILRKFHSPTIFLKIACDGDLLLPIIVGEFAIIQLINGLTADEHEVNLDQFHFAKSIVVKFGYEVQMVQITEQVVNTYHAHIYLGKPMDDVNISIDAHPSDAINVAEIFKAPIYVSKEVVLKDGIRIVYGKWRGSGKTVYDVLLDSAVEGHDPLAEEIDMIQKMQTAVLEERYEDAARWRDELTKLRMHGLKL